MTRSRFFVPIDFKKVIKGLCCDPLEFMWENSLLSPRDETFCPDPIDGRWMSLRFIMGFRVRRDFMYLKRDTVLYRCPFCLLELVAPLGSRSSSGQWMDIESIALPKGFSSFKISRTKLLEHLADTKKRCAGVWPPKD